MLHISIAEAPVSSVDTVLSCADNILPEGMHRLERDLTGAC
jgi:hypothetical protein